jgi:hypothetical protein
MSSSLKLTCSSLPDLTFMPQRGRISSPALKVLYGSWTTTETQDGTVIEAFRVFSIADKGVVRAEIRRLDQYAAAATEGASALTRETVWLYKQVVDEPVQRRAAVRGISWTAIDDNVVDAMMASKGALFDIAIERDGAWEVEQGIDNEWRDVPASACLTVTNALGATTIPAIVERLQISPIERAAFTEVWMGWKSAIGGRVDGLEKFDPTIEVNQLTVVDRVGGGTLFVGAVAGARGGVAARIDFANEDGSVIRTEHKPRLSVDFNKWNDSTQTLPALVWPQYAGKYHLLVRYHTIAPEGTSTTTPMFSISGIQFYEIGAWTEKLGVQYVPHTAGAWGTIDLGILTIGGGVSLRSSEVVALPKLRVGVAAGLPLASGANMDYKALRKYGIVVDDMTLVPAEHYAHAKTILTINSRRQLLVTGDGSGTASAWVADRNGTTLIAATNKQGPPYETFESAVVDSDNWLCPPWPYSKLVIHATRDNQPTDDTMLVTARTVARMRSYAG